MKKSEEIMIHQRNVLRLYYIIAALATLALSTVAGFIVAFIAMAIISISVTFVIKKILPPPDWYANETENSNVTSLNLTPMANSKNKPD